MLFPAITAKTHTVQHVGVGFIFPDTQQGGMTGGAVWQTVTACSNKVAAKKTFFFGC